MKIQDMIDEDAGCIQIVQQMNALLGLTKNANLAILKSHLKTCARETLLNGSEAEQESFIEELVQTFSMITKK